MTSTEAISPSGTGTDYHTKLVPNNILKNLFKITSV